ncbi:MAG: D-alanyl-D-alanine carboxypeptidase family protein [Chloroflexota bacterium]
MRLWTRLLAVVCCVALSLPTTGFGPPTLVESESATTPASPATLRQMRADRPPELLATAAVVMDADTGQLVYEKNAHERRAPASTTKMMTALVTLENARLTDVVRAGADVKVEPSIIGLYPGDQLTVEQLLYGLLLPSGNDAAIALADHVGGSIPQFAAMMNDKAAQLGLRDTHFVNPHGLDADGHYSSAHDLAVIARAALQNPYFERIVATREYHVDGPIRWAFKNSNRLLDVYPGADGVKTGYTDNAGRCLVFSASRGGHRAISVVLDSGDQYGDSADLLTYFFSNFTRDTLSVAEVPFSSYGREDEPRRAAGRRQPTIVYPAWQRPYLRWFFSWEPGSSGGEEAVGSATYYLFGKKVAEIPLYDEGG